MGAALERAEGKRTHTGAVPASPILSGLKNKKLVNRSVQLLYVQALLLGHHPLNSKEMRLLNDGLLDMIEWGVGSEG